MRLYKSYMFRGKEPIIDETRTLFEDIYGERINNKMLTDIEKKGGPTASCMRGWFFGETKRPKNETVEASGRAVGYRRKWIKMNGKG